MAKQNKTKKKEKERKRNWPLITWLFFGYWWNRSNWEGIKVWSSTLCLQICLFSFVLTTVLVLESFAFVVASKKSCLMYSFQFTLACIKMDRIELAQKAVALVEKRLPVDRWPEYYDTHTGRFIGKQARFFQTWTIAGFLASKMLLENPEMASLLFWEEDYELLEICVCGLSKSGRKKCSRFAAKSQILV